MFDCMKRLIFLASILNFSCNTENALEECPSQEPILQIHREFLMSEISATGTENGTRYYEWDVMIDTVSYGKTVDTRIRVLYDPHAYLEKLISTKLIQFSSGPSSVYYVFSPIENDSMVGHDYSNSSRFYSEYSKLCEGYLYHVVRISFQGENNDALDFEFINGALHDGSFYEIKYCLPS